MKTLCSAPTLLSLLGVLSCTATKEAVEFSPQELESDVLAVASSGTDEGWVYATVQADGAVSAYGQIPSCVACHRRAGPERMFGLPGVDREPSVVD